MLPATPSTGAMPTTELPTTDPSGGGGLDGAANVTVRGCESPGGSDPGSATVNPGGSAEVIPVTVNAVVPRLVTCTLSPADPLMSTSHNNEVGETSIQGCAVRLRVPDTTQDRKSTRLNSSHL